jgi:hypothetical protein
MEVSPLPLEIFSQLTRVSETKGRLADRLFDASANHLKLCGYPLTISSTEKISFSGLLRSKLHDIRVSQPLEI